MSPTVHELRNRIRVAVDRYERVENTQFTKESLAAIANAVGHRVKGKPLPPKEEMRAGIRRRVGLGGGDDGSETDGPETDGPETDGSETDGGAFLKADLEAIASALEDC